MSNLTNTKAAFVEAMNRARNAVQSHTWCCGSHQLAANVALLHFSATKNAALKQFKDGILSEAEFIIVIDEGTRAVNAFAAEIETIDFVADVDINMPAGIA